MDIATRGCDGAVGNSPFRTRMLVRGVHLQNRIS